MNTVFTSVAGSVAKYCDEYVCVSVSVCDCLSERTFRNHTRDIYYFCILPMAVARSSSGVVEIRYVLMVLWMTSCFFYNLPYEFRYEEPILLKFTYLRQSLTEFNFPSLKGIILTNYFGNTRKLKQKKRKRKMWRLTGRITETHVVVAIVTMVTAKLCWETNIFWCMDVGKRS